MPALKWSDKSVKLFNVLPALHVRKPFDVMQHVPRMVQSLLLLAAAMVIRRQQVRQLVRQLAAVRCHRSAAAAAAVARRAARAVLELPDLQVNQVAMEVMEMMDKLALMESTVPMRQLVRHQRPLTSASIVQQDPQDQQEVPDPRDRAVDPADPVRQALQAQAQHPDKQDHPAHPARMVELANPVHQELPVNLAKLQAFPEHLALPVHLVSQVRTVSQAALDHLHLVPLDLLATLVLLVHQVAQEQLVDPVEMAKMAAEAAANIAHHHAQAPAIKLSIHNNGNYNRRQHFITLCAFGKFTSARLSIVSMFSDSTYSFVILIFVWKNVGKT